MLEWENPEIARINREEPHCIFIPFRMKPIQIKVSMFNDSELSYEDLICLFVNDKMYSTKKILVPPGMMENYVLRGNTW